jgi:hypothetical protein
MGCNGDHYLPNCCKNEEYKVKRLVKYVFPLLGKPIPKFRNVYDLADNHMRDALDEGTALLCECCGNMSPEQQAKIIFDGRISEARELAEWWQEHQDADSRKAIIEKTKSVFELNKEKKWKIEAGSGPFWRSDAMEPDRFISK